jgi:hypothetical protein
MKFKRAVVVSFDGPDGWDADGVAKFDADVDVWEREVSISTVAVTVDGAAVTLDEWQRERVIAQLREDESSILREFSERMMDL